MRPADVSSCVHPLGLLEQKLAPLTGLSPDVLRGLVNRDYMDAWM